MKIGICGLGRMGTALAQRLLDCGHEITVWNRDQNKAKPLLALGAKVATSPAALAATCELTLTILFDAEAIAAVYRGPNGIFSADIDGKFLMDMSTVLPETAEQLGQDAARCGARFIECPVGGTVGPAREGKLLGLVGGATADIAAIQPILMQICRRIEPVGPVGSGAKLKLAINLPLMVYWQALGEALTLVAPLNLPPERLIDILSDTSGTPTAMKGRGPAIARLLAGEPAPSPAFEISAARKDLATMLAFAKQLGASLPVTKAALDCYLEAECAGLSQADPIHIPVFWAAHASYSKPLNERSKP